MSILISALLAATLGSTVNSTTVPTEWLAEHLTDANVIVVEVGTLPDGAHPHIPGARYLPLASIVAGNDDLPPVEKLRDALGKAGIGDEGRIILYGTTPLAATRAWFTLDYLGHGDRAAILDGGFEKWRKEKRLVADVRYARQARTFTPLVNESRVISHQAMRAAVAEGAEVIDARPGRPYAAGHITKASCVPWRANLAENGTFLTAGKLRELYGVLIDQPEKKVIVYCRTGMEATMDYFVLRTLGYDVVLYDGSWTEWSKDADAPVVRIGV